MTYACWAVYRRGFECDEKVRVFWLWNWGRNKGQRERSLEGRIDKIDQTGIVIDGKHPISYKRIDAIEAI